MTAGYLAEERYSGATPLSMLFAIRLPQAKCFHLCQYQNGIHTRFGRCNLMPCRQAVCRNIEAAPSSGRLIIPRRAAGHR